MFILILFAIIAQHGATGADDARQSVKVQGKLICNGTSYSDARVILFNTKVVPIKLSETSPSVTGDFAISYSGNDLIPLSPVLNIYHRCLYRQPMKLCARLLSIEVPSTYVTNNDSRVNATYDIGIMNLNLKFSFEMVDCIFGAYSQNNSAI